MTEAQISEALEAAARAGDAQAKAFIRMWYSKRTATKGNTEPGTLET